MVTSSVEAVHTPLEMVHLNVTFVPAATPVIVVVGEAAFVIEAVPLTTVHCPLPTIGVLAAMVKVEVLQSAWSDPAVATLGNSSF